MTYTTALAGLKMRRWTAAAWVTMTVTAVFFLAAYAGPGWVFTHQWYSHESSGLWQRCRRWSDLTTCENIVNKLDGDPEWLNATRALMSLAGIGLIAAIILFAITFCWQSANRTCLLSFQAIILFLSCILIFVAVVVYGVEYDYEHSSLAYSFYLSCVSCLGSFLAGLFSVLDACQGDYL